MVIVYLHYSHHTLNDQLRGAAEYGRTERVVRLLGEGADPNDQDQYGWTAVHIACYTNNHQILSILLEHKNIDVNVRTNINDTPLHVACGHGSLKCADALVECGADTG